MGEVLTIPIVWPKQNFQVVGDPLICTVGNVSEFIASPILREHVEMIVSAIQGDEFLDQDFQAAVVKTDLHLVWRSINAWDD